MKITFLGSKFQTKEVKVGCAMEINILKHLKMQITLGKIKKLLKKIIHKKRIMEEAQIFALKEIMYAN